MSFIILFHNVCVWSRSLSMPPEAMNMQGNSVNGAHAVWYNDTGEIYQLWSAIPAKTDQHRPTHCMEDTPYPQGVCQEGPYRLCEHSLCHDCDPLQPSPTHSRAHKLTPEILHSFPTPNTCSQSHSITPNLIGLNLIACTYLSLVLVPCLSLPHIRYSTSTSFPLSVLPEFSISVNPIPPNP